MRKVIAVGLTLGLLIGAQALPADAKKKKKKKAPAPVEVTWYLHGGTPVGEAEIPDGLDGIWKVMNDTEPSDAAPKSQFITNYGGGPNTNCSGNWLFPVWKGAVSGTVVGDVKLTIHTGTHPGSTFNAQLFPDASGGCNESAQPAAAEVLVEAAPGMAATEVVFEDVNFQVFANLYVQLAPVLPVPAQTRVFYDGTSHASSLNFSYLP